MEKSVNFKTVLALAMLLLALPGFAGEQPIMDAGAIDVKAAGELFKKPGYSPYANRNFPIRVF